MIGIFNGLVTKRNQADEANAQIQVQLERRHDLIPNPAKLAENSMPLKTANGATQHLYIVNPLKKLSAGDDLSRPTPDRRSY